MASNLEPVEPAEPIARWFGGKRVIAQTIIARIEAVPHKCYAEPFVGMGGVFLRRRLRPRTEVVNDLNGDIVNLFRVVREHPDELLRQFRWMLQARSEWRRLLDVRAETLTDVQRAARFVYLQLLTFSGLPATNATPGWMSPNAASRAPMYSADRLRRLVAAAHRRLQRVHIESMDWRDFLERYDRPFTLFYLDPPYWGNEDTYGKGMFERADYQRMAEILGGIEGRFVLSVNDRPELRGIFGAFDIETIAMRYTAKGFRRTSELLVSN